MSPGPRLRNVLLVLGSAIALVIALPGTAFAAPPGALPANADELERQFEPVFDYDTDGCYATPAIGSGGELNSGLKPSGALNGNCRDQSDLDNTNSYSRAKCNNGWCAIMYGLYFEKDQIFPTFESGHRHDWEHVVVWVQDNEAKYVATSAHGGFNVHDRDAVRWQWGSHAKVVYHKDGPGTHAFRLANGNDEPPENHYGTWQYVDLVGWNGYPSTELRDKLSNANWGSANFGLKDGNFNAHLEKAKPSGIPFDPHA